MARFWKTAAFILATAYFVVDGVLSYVTRPRDFGAGAITFVTAEALKLTFVERLFQLNRKKLLSIPAFASGYHSGYHIDGSLEGDTKTGRQHCTFASDSSASIFA